MAVELRCPECRAKLRLPVAPEEGSEIECPKCGHVFPAEGNAASGARRADRDDEEDKPRKKTARDTDDDDQPKKKKKGKKTATKAGGPAGQPRKKKRKLKKRKSNQMVLIGAIIGGLMVLGFFIGAIVWFFSRKSASQEMMMYLPDDCDEISGLNLGHLQKYPEFYKSCETAFGSTGFKRAADQFSKALGQEMNDTIDYVVQGVGKSGGQEVAATVLRTKAEFDTSLLNKLPGAAKGTRNGVDFYTINNIPELGYGGVRVFAPTNRLVVFCRADTPDSKFNAMLNGNKDSPDSTPFVRGGQLSKQVVRGTVWKFMIYGRSVAKLSASAPQGGQGGGQESDEDMLKKEIAEIISSAQGCGFKASVGSREVRGEWIVWYKDSDAANSMLKKWKEKEWIKDEEKDPPKFWKAVAQKSGGGKTAPNVLRDGLAFRQSGETFSIRTSMDVNLVKNGVSSLVTAFTPQASGGPGMPGMPGMPMGGMPPGKPRRRDLRPRGTLGKPIRGGRTAVVAAHSG
jgi:transcription initiation factor TFIIIB Brf1 subunit/transcription initiation factor TFIIB